MDININFVKGATEFVTSFCGSYTVGAIVGSLCPVNNPIAKIMFTVGGGAIGGMIGDAAGKYAANVVGDVCKMLDGPKEQNA